MAVETATYISDLNSSNPASGDARSEGDDHLRLLKSTIKATFPSVTGAVTATHTELNVLDGITATTTELNYCDGVTSPIQTQLDSKGASLTARTPVTATGTTIDLTTGISASTTAIDIYVAGASTGSLIGAGTALRMQLGDSGGIETTGYVPTTSYQTVAVGIDNAGDTVESYIQLRRLSPSTNFWAVTVSTVAENNEFIYAGRKELTAALTTVRLYWSGGESFDAGTIYYACN